jgi:hypothetical protein
MSTTFEFADTVRRKIDDRIASLTDNLISASSDKHDKLAGEILGLRAAKKEMLDLARKWQTADFDEGDHADGLAH